MQHVQANQLCAENLAVKISLAISCEQPDRAPLDLAIAKKIVESNARQNPLLYGTYQHARK